MPQPSLDHADRSVDVSIIRKTLLSLLEFRQCRGEIALPVIAVITKSKMSLGEVWIQRERTIEGILGCRQPRRTPIESYSVIVALPIGEKCPSQYKIWIQLHSLLI